MQQLKILNSKETKEILKLIEEQWGAKLKLDHAFLKNNKNRVFIVNKDISKIDYSKLRINSTGLYFCEIDKIGIRLSIEGSQIVGPKATKNIADISDDQVKKWFKGEDLEVKGKYSGFILIKHNKDFLGSGKIKENKILNFVPKIRRLNVTGLS